MDREVLYKESDVCWVEQSDLEDRFGVDIVAEMSVEEGKDGGEDGGT